MTLVITDFDHVFRLKDVRSCSQISLKSGVESIKVVQRDLSTAVLIYLILIESFKALSKAYLVI